MVAINQTTNTAQTTLFVYEVASGVVLRNRTVTGQSTVLSMSPDGSRFMAGSTLYDTSTLGVIAQQNTANLKLLERNGYPLDHEAVIQCAADNGKAIETNLILLLHANLPHHAKEWQYLEVFASPGCGAHVPRARVGRDYDRPRLSRQTLDFQGHQALP